MTLVSLAQAARCLGIDAKTLHRWLADAQLPLQAHPADGRTKGVSGEQLARLARLHQRRLAPLPTEPPVPDPAEPPLASLPAVLLTLPATLSALQSQLTALQQQIATLTSLLPQPGSQPAVPPSPAPPSRPPKRFATPPSSAPRARSAPSAPAHQPAKPAHVIPQVEYDQQGRYVVICPKQGRLPFEPDTPQWFAWVSKQSSFRFLGKEGHFTAHHEWRVPKGAWRAHRQIRNRNYTLRLAPNQELTIAVLEQAAQALQAHLA